MMNELNELLMMFIKDGYSASGKISKKTALAMMKFVGGNKALQSHVNNSDWDSVLTHKQSEWVSVDTPPWLQFESEEDPDSDGYPQFDGMVSQTVEVTDGEARSFGHFRSDGVWIIYIKDHDFDMLNVDPSKVAHYKTISPLPINEPKS